VDEELKITNEVDRRNNAICRFTVDRTLHIGPVTFNSKEEAQASPLASKLFEIDGLTRVQLIGKLLVVTKSDDREWSEIGGEVEAVLTSYLISGLALTKEQVEHRMMVIGRDIKERIQYLIDHQINPGVAAHAGFVELIDVKDRIVYLRLGGGCQGCVAADFTLRQGIEAIIRKEVPEIRQILDITDHAAGMNPYYRPAK
jgi:Fe-S cluster biogenesis protein NfuA